MKQGVIKYKPGNIAALKNNGLTALHKAADATLTDIVQALVIPFDVGTMQNDQTFVDTSDLATTGKVYIVTSAVQATRLYFHPEYNFQTVNNPNAKGGWFEDWIDGSKKDFIKHSFSVFYSRLNNKIGGAK